MAAGKRPAKRPARKRPARKRCRRPLKLRSRVVRRHGKRQRVYRCVRPRKRLPGAPVTQPPVVAPPATQPPSDPPAGFVVPPPPPSMGPPVQGVPVYSGPFGRREAERLLWRAGFGPVAGWPEQMATFGVEGAVRSLSRPQVPEQLTGPEPRGNDGQPLAPLTTDGHDHLWWLDRMVRTNRPLIERMALIWHDWFATSDASVNSVRLMMIQNELFRRQGLGSFRELLLKIASDGAMLKWLNGWVNKAGKPDENYARESMELFTLGADRGAYTEMDVREMARAHTGWAADLGPEGWTNFRIKALLQDQGEKTIFGQRANFDWQGASHLCCDHPMHPSFLVNKLWGYFIPTPPDSDTRKKLEDAYTGGGQVVLPIVEAILMHPDLYTGEPMVKPPVVYAAGLLRALGKGVRGDTLFTWTETAGQRLFRPPNVSGWDDDAWLDTTTMRARWLMVFHLLMSSTIDWARPYDATESPSLAVQRAVAFWGDPPISAESRQALEAWAAKCVPPGLPESDASQIRAMRQNALRQLIGASPDLQVC